MATCADTSVLVDRAVAYVDLLGQSLGSVLATERYVQELAVASGGEGRFETQRPPAAGGVGSGALSPLLARTPAVRTLRSAFLFARPLDDQQTWQGFRDVQTVDGRAVEPARKAALEIPGEAPLARWSRLSDESARYNIGATARTINVPTFALIALHPRHRERFTFSSSAPSRKGATTCVLAFRETGTPALVQGPPGMAFQTSGSFQLDRVTGRVERSVLTLSSTASDVRATATVTYARDARLDLWLPKQMREEYVTPGVERIVGVADYRDYRRADVTSRIVPQP